MKVWVRNRYPVVAGRTIEVVLEFEDANQQVAAAIVKPRSVNKSKLELSSTQLSAYIEFLEAALSQIAEHFRIRKHGQSHKSYTYYVEFEVPVVDRQEIQLWTIKFRLSHHMPKIADIDKRINPASRLRIRNIVIGNKQEFHSTHEALIAVDDMLKHLKDGDLSILDKDYSGM